MNEIQRKALESERDHLRKEIDRLDRRFRDLKNWKDAQDLAAKRNRLWDVEDELRVVAARKGRGA